MKKKIEKKCAKIANKNKKSLTFGFDVPSYSESKSRTLEIVFSITLENDYCIMKVGEKIEASKECFAVSLLP